MGAGPAKHGDDRQGLSALRFRRHRSTPRQRPKLPPRWCHRCTPRYRRSVSCLPQSVPAAGQNLLRTDSSKIAGPGIALRPAFRYFRPANGLHRLDACLTAPLRRSLKMPEARRPNGKWLPHPRRLQPRSEFFMGVSGSEFYTRACGSKPVWREPPVRGKFSSRDLSSNIHLPVVPSCERECWSLTTGTERWLCSKTRMTCW